MKPSVIEIRVHSKWGGSGELWFVSVFFDDVTVTRANREFDTEVEAQLFADGVVEGLALRQEGEG